MALNKSSNAELGIWSVEGWTRALAGWEVVRDSSVFHGGAWSWLVAGDGVQKGSILPFTGRGSLHPWVIRMWVRLNNWPSGAGGEPLFVAPASASTVMAPLTVGTDGRLSATNGAISYPASSSPPLTVGTWYKLEIAVVQQGATQQWTQAIWRLNDVEFARQLVRTNGGQINGLSTSAGPGAVARTNVDDIVINDDTGSTALYWNDADKPRSTGKIAPTVRSVATPVTGSAVVASVVVNQPPSVVAGDLLVAVLEHDPILSVNSLPSGWAAVANGQATTGANVGVFSKRATGSEPATYTFGLTAGSRSVSTCYALTSVSSASPVIDARVAVGGAPSNTPEVALPILDLTEGDALILQAVASTAAPTLTPPAWWSSVSGAKDATNSQELRAGVYASTDGGLVTADLVAASGNLSAAGVVSVGFRGVLQTPLLTAAAGSASLATAVVSTAVTGGTLPQSLDPLAIFSAAPALEPLDLLDEVPPFERSSYEIQAVLKVVGNELARIDAARQALIQNFFPASADTLLPRFEAMLGLPVAPPTLDLNTRRAVVLAYMQRLKSEGRGLDWIAAMNALAGQGWSYQEHLTAPPTNLVPNPSFEYDAVGVAPALWTSFDVGPVPVSTGWSEVGSRSSRFTYTTPDATSRWLGWKTPFGVSGIPVTAGLPYSARAVVNVLTPEAQGSTFNIRLRWFTAAGVQLTDAGGPVLAAGYMGRGVVTVVNAIAPPGAAYVSVVLINNSPTIAAGQAFDAYLDAVMLVQAASLPTFFSGDTPGYQWAGTPGNSQSYQSSPAANTISVKIPSALAGAGWPYVRDITPAHIAISQSYSDGFFVGITNIGSNL